MGRSVNYPSNAAAVRYVDTSWVGYSTDDDGDSFFDEYQSQDDWDYFIDDVYNIVKSKYPSFEKANSWIGNELNVIAENNHAQIVVSEYCGLASISLVAKQSEGYYSEDIRNDNIANAWTGQIANNFTKLIAKNFINTYAKLASMSNGEGVFERV